MNIARLGEAINKYFMTSHNLITIKILKLLDNNIFLVETGKDVFQAKITEEVNIGDVIKAKLLTKNPIPTFEKISNTNSELKTDNLLFNMLDNFNAQDFEAYVLKSLDSKNIKDMFNKEKMKLISILEKQLDSSKKADLTSLSNYEPLKINSKELYQLLFNRYLFIYFRSPEYDIKDGFLYIKKRIKSGIKCRLFLYFSNIGRIFIAISGLEDRYNVIIKSDSDLTSVLKNISIDNATIRYKKFTTEKFEDDDISYSNYFTIKI
jgi:hypothetical protein